jgi:hypothetical protein
VPSRKPEDEIAMRFNCAAGHDQTNIDSAGEGGNVVLDFIGEMTPG